MANIEDIAAGWPVNDCSGICIKRDGTIIFTADNEHCVYTFRPGIDEDPVVLAGHKVESSHINEPGTDARFDRPQGIALCVDGSLVVADSGNNRVRKISPEGVVTTVAGSGQEGFADGPGAVAMFNDPYGVAVRADGIVVADCGNDRIRLISPAGLVTTLAGSGTHGFSDGSAAEARFRSPCGVAVCPDGAVLVCDFGNHRLRRIAAGSSAVLTVAGLGADGHLDGIRGAATFHYPTSIAVDTAGHAVVSEYFGCIRKIKLTTGEVTTVASGLGNHIYALAIDVDGSIVFVNPRTRMLSKIINIGLGPGFSVEGFPPIWTATRLNHLATPDWSRDAVGTVMLASKRASRVNGLGSGWLGRVPVLPRVVWEMIIGLIPRYHIGRLASAAPVHDSGLELWLEEQMRMYERGEWGGGVEEDTEDE